MKWVDLQQEGTGGTFAVMIGGASLHSSSGGSVLMYTALDPWGRWVSSSGSHRDTGQNTKSFLDFFSFPILITLAGSLA